MFNRAGHAERQVMAQVVYSGNASNEALNRTKEWVTTGEVRTDQLPHDLELVLLQTQSQAW